MSKAKEHTVVPQNHNVLSVVNTRRPGRLTNQLQYLENEVLEELWNHEYSGPFQVLMDPVSLPVRESTTERAPLLFLLKIVPLNFSFCVYKSLDSRTTCGFVVVFQVYYKVIKNPMDLSTIRKRLRNRYYKHAMECIQDFLAIFINCFTFHKVTGYILVFKY